MPIQGLQDVQAMLASLRQAQTAASQSAMRKALDQARQAAIDATTKRYNVEAETIAPYVDAKVDSQSADGASGTLTLKVRALPMETFGPQVRMRHFSYTDSLGRHYSTTLPAIYYARLRGKAPKYLAPAFPLHQRTSGPLMASDHVVKRTGRARGKLTRFRFYTFPQQFLSQTLLPQVRQAIPENFSVAFDAAFRNARGRLRHNGV